jgi:beta-galactosidase
MKVQVQYLPEADRWVDERHHFLANDGPATTVILDMGHFRYASVCDAVTQQPLALGAPIDLEAYSGRWLRFDKT